MISLEKLKILTHLQKLPKNVGNLAKLIVVKGPKSNKLPYLVTLQPQKGWQSSGREDDEETIFKKHFN